MKELTILGYSVSTLPVAEIVSDSLSTDELKVVNTINPHSYAESKNDEAFHRALLDSTVLIPDGSGIVLAAKKLHKKKINKIAGTDLFFETMKQLDDKSGSVFLLGSTDAVLNKMKTRALKEFPNVQCYILSPPYKAEFSEKDKISFTDAINASGADVIFVGLTAPKQEKLINGIRRNISGSMVSGIGAVFDFYAGTVKRPSQIWLDLHLEWLVRLIGEPKRLWQRTFVSAPIFLVDMYRQKYTGYKNEK